MTEKAYKKQLEAEDVGDLAFQNAVVEKERQFVFI